MITKTRRTATIGLDWCSVTWKTLKDPWTLQIRLHVLGNHQHTASSYHWLGSVQRDMGDLEGAMDSLQTAANMRSRVLGDHEDTASSNHQLGLVQRDMGDLKRASDSLQKAEDMRTKLLGDHGDTTSSLNKLRAVRGTRSLLGKVFRRKNRDKNNVTK